MRPAFPLPAEDLQRHRFAAMGGWGEMVLGGCAAAVAQIWMAQAAAEVQRIEHKYSRYREGSWVVELNRQAGRAAVEADDETLTLLTFADTLVQDSDGLFDPTSGVLRQAWDFRAGRRPHEDELPPLLARIGWERVERKGHSVRLPEVGMELDFGGFGKEYAADRAAVLLMQCGARSGYVNLGGDMRVLGPKPDGSPWQIGIQHPRLDGQLSATLPLEGGGLATSGDYERFFEHNGVRYCHILNPKTGWPVRHWQSVSVLAPQAVTAGAISTLALLKEEAALPFLRATGLPFLAIDANGQTHLHTDS
ncbi:FAD:protein FMN transferase [Inhella gelatinilytica]|uniref:FAD:protein FMN transferase n=1 Tax=Inhella gelatinilytica TaxID=2795030 RepID=A0A931IX56_9BURK|nr:FAD:protein FMN transferase [Inhella gelatinilytica]MBH9552689.1 FAD:protein FMN transferase [Inhella gelatinilytica]